MHRVISMKVAYDIATYPVFRDNDLYYPALASVLAILHCGGEAIIFKSTGAVTTQEKRLIDKLIGVFGGQIRFSDSGAGADMCVS